jgi:opacity protein-like surface antigen
MKGTSCLLRDGFPCPRSLVRALFLASSAIALAASLLAQADDQPYARKNSFGVLTAYSPDSSHIFLGIAENRELLDFGLSYTRRLLLNHTMNWQVDVEFLPLAINSDPVQVTTTTTTYITPPVTLTTTQSVPTTVACQSSSGSGNFGPNAPTYTYVTTCTRRWVPGQEISPIGMQWNFLPRRKLQPVFEGHLGYQFSTLPIPTSNAGSFNFAFDVGAGFELYRNHSHSYRVEYRYHHLSNHETASDNPGIDNAVIQVSWLFGR